jgi:hypothetical protein
MTITPGSLGQILAILALVLAVVFAAIGHLSILIAGLVVLLAVARLT